MGPCPWPREIALTLAPSTPVWEANLSKAAMGSAPGDRMKIIGTLFAESK